MQEIHDLFRKYLGRKCHKHTGGILSDLICISNGVKPGYLLDCISLQPQQQQQQQQQQEQEQRRKGPQPQPQDLIELIADLHDKRILPNRLQVLTVDDDCFVMNIPCILKHLDRITCNDSSSSESPVSLVDVSRDLDSAEVITKQRTKDILTAMSDVIHPQLVSACDSHLLKLDLSTEVNRTTLYGLLLGFPVVYWYATPHDVSLNDLGLCLAMRPLKVCKVLLKLHWEKVLAESPWSLLSKPLEAKSFAEHCLYSFSFPDSLKQELQSNSDNWTGRLKRTSVLDNLVSDIQIVWDIVTLPSVTL